MLISAHLLLAGIQPEFPSDCSPSSDEMFWSDFPSREYSIFNVLDENLEDLSTATEDSVPMSFIYDTAAAASLVRDLTNCNLSTYVRTKASEVKITGIGGSHTEVLGSVRLLAPFSHIRAWHAPNAIANILSSIEIQKMYMTQFRDQNTADDRIECDRHTADYHITANFNKHEKTGFYMFNYDPTPTVRSINPSIFSCNVKADPKAVMSVIKEAHALGLSKDAIKRALKVEALHRSLSYTSLESLENIVRRCPYGFDILPSDVSVYRRYLHARRCIACAIGKTTTAPAPESDRLKASTVGERIIADIFFIKSDAFNRNDIYLLTIDEFCGQIHIQYLESRSLDHVKDAFSSIIAEYRKFGATVKNIRLDREATFDEIGVAYAGPLNISVEPCIPGRHARVAERAIRTICNLFRSTIAGLPYVLAPHLYCRLMEYVVTSRNLVTNCNNTVMSSQEIFSGKSPDYKKHLSMSFGDLVTYATSSKNTDDGRAVVGLIVGRSMDTPGGAIIWDMNNGGSVIRHDAHPIDWNDMLLDRYIKISRDSIIHNGLLPENHDHWLDRRKPIYKKADLLTSEADIDTLISELETGMQIDSEQITLSDQSAISKAKIDGEVLNRDYTNLPAVHDVYIGKSVDDEDDYTSQAAIFSRNENLMSIDPKTTHEAHDKNQVKDRNKIFLGAGYEDNILPKRTRGPKVLHMSIKQCQLVFPKSEIRKAIIDELNQMFAKEVWRAMTRDAVKAGYKDGTIKNIITSSLFLKDKKDAANKFLKLKARLVAHGNRQLMDDMFGSKSVESPTSSLASIMILLHLSASKGWKKTCLDVGGAYLNATLADPEYMRISKELVALLNDTDSAFPETEIQEDGTVVVQLRKALYGLKQAGRAWYDLLTKELESHGYQRSDIDRCLFTKIVGDSITHIAVYVDDLLIVGNDEVERSNLKEKLRLAYSEITVQESDNFSFVGLEIHTAANKSVQIRQIGYIKDVLKHFNIGENEFEDHPCSDNIMKTPKADDPSVDKSLYLSGVMKLMYLSTRSRPDIAFAVSALASRSSDPKENDMKAMIRIAKYINKTKDEFLIFKHGGQISLSAFVDASFMCHRDMRSHTGYAIFADTIGSAGIVYRSIKQTTVSNSSTEAEIIALHDLVQHLIWIQGIYDSLQIDYNKPTTIYNDNEATIRMNSVPIVNFAGRSKYIARKYFSVYEHVENGSVILKWIGTDDMIADVLTKAIMGNKFRKFKIHLLGNTTAAGISEHHNIE